MKISIITEGKEETGYGHVARCYSLYQAFEARNILPVLYVNGDGNCHSYLPDARYEIIDWLRNEDELISKVQGSDVVIVDSYLALKDFYDRIAGISKFSLFLDDTLRISYPAATVLNSAVNAETLGYPPNENVTYLLGSKYALLRKEFWDTFERTHRIDIQNVIITFGGQDIRNLTPRILKILSRNFPEVRKKVVVGSGFSNKQEIVEAADANTEIFSSPGAAEMLKIMYDADLAISAGGQTLFELARVGVPTIAVAVADNQINNINSWVKEKFLPSELSYLQPNLENHLLLLFNNMKKKAIREMYARAGKLKVDGAGAKRTVQHLIDKFTAETDFYFRRAMERDAVLLFNLANDKLVRSNSFNSEPIKWGDHLDWFTGKLMNDDCMLLLAFTASDGFIGQVRCDMTDDYAEIHISIDKNFRKKGFSRKLISGASKKCFNEYSGVKYILAKVKESNSASVKTFLGAGYVYHDKTRMNDEDVSIYLLSRPLPK